ncbi:MAG TPA: efflux transporter outer membrane subunit [Dongiaceae bacterium]|jgi:NodT family efflux transporter outer membrane factor (OMF) lipoprotein|nr:efflux transporter outer membrane subunit [Dongiaceae bacterium]
MPERLHRPSSWRRCLTGATALLLCLSACEVGPDYKRPAAPTPAAYKEESKDWKIAEPQQAGSNQAWWSIYNDPVLDDLEKQIAISNESVKSSEAAYRQAVALVGEARAGFFPTLSLDTSLQRSHQQSKSTTQYSGSVGASWELDIWGKIRREVESAKAGAQVSAADLAAAKLSLQAELATDYFQLRTEDELQRLLNATVDAFARSLQIAQNRYDVGVAAKTDVASAQAQLESTRAQAINVGVLRSQLEHAIAVLIGKPPADFTLAPAPGVVAAVPLTPPGLPSQLLERRPDIAAAERQMAEANAQIGVAVSAYYPSITLEGSVGFAATAASSFFAPESLVWAVGPALAETLFDGGLRGAQVEAAKASFEQTVALYRQTVLTAFQQVEDQLAALRILAQQAAVQDGAVKASQEAERLTLNQYEAGMLDYTSVITAQANALSSQQTALGILQNRVAASVALVAALGGGWDASQLPQNPEPPLTLP